MGQKLVLPPIQRRSCAIIMSYGIRESHLRQLWRKFVEMDVDCNGFWTIAECYRLIQEPRTTMLAPMMDALFDFADRNNNGSLGFEDFLVSVCSFNALSKEEVLQFFFVVVDRDRSGHIGKDELMEYFSYRGVSATESGPIFPVNNKNALEFYRNGNWKKLYFDEFAQLCELFPYISYPAFQLQKVFRSSLLGRNFWTNWDRERMHVMRGESESRRTEVKVRTPDGDDIVVRPPGRFTMKDILEYSRRKSMTQNGKKVARPLQQETSKGEGGSVTAERDEQLSRTPLLNIIRNPHAAYHVPYLETAGFDFGAQEVTRERRPSILGVGVDELETPSDSEEEWIQEVSAAKPPPRAIMQ